MIDEAIISGPPPLGGDLKSQGLNAGGQSEGHRSSSIWRTISHLTNPHWVFQDLRTTKTKGEFSNKPKEIKLGVRRCFSSKA